jgi:uncharacterized protein YndB with AHSA1/START domain
MAAATWLLRHGSRDGQPGRRPVQDVVYSFTNFTTGHSHSFGGEYLELEPGKRVRYTAEFDDPHLPGKMQTTVTLREVSVGVEVMIKQEGIPAAIPAEACYLGWQESLELLAKLVEPEIKD